MTPRRLGRDRDPRAVGASRHGRRVAARLLALATAVALSACVGGGASTDDQPSSTPPTTPSATTSPSLDPSDAGTPTDPVAAALSPPWRLVPGCDPSLVDGLERLASDWSPVPAMSGGDVDGDGIPDHVAAATAPTRDDEVVGAVVVADGRIVPIVRDGALERTPVLTVDLDADGVDEVIVFNGGNTAGGVSVASLDGCRLETDEAWFGVWAVGSPCAPDCGLGTHCLPQPSGEVHLQEMYWQANPGDRNGDGVEDLRDADDSEPEDWNWSWSLDTWALLDGTMTQVDVTSGEGSLADLASLELHDGLVCGDVSIPFLGDAIWRPAGSG